MYLNRKSITRKDVMMSVSSMYMDIFDGAIAARHSLVMEQYHRVRPSKRMHSHIKTTSSGSGSSLGAYRLAKIRGTMESGLGLQRSKTQVRMHEAFLNACARFLYSEDTSAPDYTAVLEANAWDDLRQQVLCMTPRRVRSACHFCL